MQSTKPATILSDNYKHRLRKSTREKRKHHARIRSSTPVTSVQKTGKCSRCDKRDMCHLVEQGYDDICNYYH
ncbi:hypothetical protein [uncultured Methanolobus sp.]|uniref:hypothetical protein n=1 Tax=uncultured Methanolobus sp. TaxID=218300 RepID=UPI0029C68FFB|nr:hypothetical protein [uncultured Methanolobus sp.]